ARKESPAEAGQELILEGNQDEDTATGTKIATVLRLEGFSCRNLCSVSEKSQRSLSEKTKNSRERKRSKRMKRQQPKRKEKHRNGQRRANHEQQHELSKLRASHDVQQPTQLAIPRRRVSTSGTVYSEKTRISQALHKSEPISAGHRWVPF